MYEYLNRPPQVGDIVEMQHNWNVHGQPIGQLSVVLAIYDNGRDVQINDNRDLKDSWYATSYFKVVKTKPATEAKVGDTVICVTPTDKMNQAGIYKGYISTVADTEYGFYIKSRRSAYTESNWLVLCKAEEKPMNPFKVGDRVRSISNDNPTDRPIGSTYTVCKVYGTDVYYKDGYAAHYSKFELVSEADPDTTIKVGSHWAMGNTDTVIIVKVNSDNDVTYSYLNKPNQTCTTNGKWFLENYKPKPNPDKPQLLHQKWKDLYDQGVELEWKWDYEKNDNLFRPILNVADTFNRTGAVYRIKPSVQETVELTKQEEQTMNKLDLKVLMSIMAAMAASEEVTKDATNSEYVCIMTKNDQYEGYFYADSMDEANKVMQSPEHEGKKLHCYHYESTIAQKPRKVITVDRV